MDMVGKNNFQMPSLTILTSHETFTFQKIQILMTKEIHPKTKKMYIPVVMGSSSVTVLCYWIQSASFSIRLLIAQWIHWFWAFFPSFSFPFPFPLHFLSSFSSLPFLPSSPPSCHQPLCRQQCSLDKDTCRWWAAPPCKQRCVRCCGVGLQPSPALMNPPYRSHLIFFFQPGLGPGFFLILGSSAFFASLLSLFLPETLQERTRTEV